MSKLYEVVNYRLDCPGTPLHGHPWPAFVWVLNDKGVADLFLFTAKWVAWPNGSCGLTPGSPDPARVVWGARHSVNGEPGTWQEINP